ncbi:MAG: aldehyde dehydrogenase family protein, partial [Planctomycetota bacterium]|nr:aldehyde dehydrogenase family protein [Planctomycetota bacterium]
MHQVLINGQWRDANSSGTFSAANPETRETHPDHYPVSEWVDCNEALNAANEAFVELQNTDRSKIALFLETYAAQIEERAEELVELAHLETALAKSPRLADVELPRTTNQLRQAAQAALDGSWTLATIDSGANIRSMYAGLGPVAVFGP